MENTEKIENISVRDREIDDNVTVFHFVCPSNMALESVVCLEPPCVLRFTTTTRHKAIVLRKIGIPLPMCTSRLQAIEFAFNWRQRQDDPILRNGAVMNHAAIRRFIPRFFGLFAVFVDSINDNIAISVIAVPASFIPKANHVTGIGIEFWMCRERRSLDLTVKVPPSDRFECGRVHGKWWTIFLSGEQDTAMEDDVGIGSSTDHPVDDRIILC